MLHQPTRGRTRRAAATVEFAVVAPLLLLFVLGIIDFGRMMMVQQVVTNASREGARIAAVEGSTPEQVEKRVQDYMRAASVPPGSVVVTTNSSRPGIRDSCTVRVETDMDHASWVPSTFLNGKKVHATTTMRAERP